MVLLDQIWDDLVAGPRPEPGFHNPNLNIVTKDLGESSKLSPSLSLPGTPDASLTPITPRTPTSPSPRSHKDNMWRGVFNPRSNPNNKAMGSNVFDKPQPNSPSVYDWLYNKDTRSKHHR